MYTKEIEQEILYLGGNVKQGLLTWVEGAKQIGAQFNISLSDDAFRNKYNRLKQKGDLVETSERLDAINKIDKSFDAQSGGWTINGVAALPKDITNDPIKVQEYLGYPANKWELKKFDISAWQQHTKEQVTKELFAFKFSVAPKAYEPSTEDILKSAQNIFDGVITPFNYTPKKLFGIDNEKMIYLPGIELHYGKNGYEGITEVYNNEIAGQTFEKIINSVLDIQDYYRSGALYVNIGNDFFHFDTHTYTTTAGTAQDNDGHWMSVYEGGVNLWVKALLTLQDKFDNIYVAMMPGNHDTMATFWTYLLLKNKFANSNIHFSDDLKETQAMLFGSNLIVHNHGEKNFKMLVDNLPHMFKSLWAQSKQVHLFKGHLHTKNVALEKSGIIVHQLSAASGMDEWHEKNHYNSSTRQQQIFVFDKNDGLVNEYNVTFNDKKLTK